MEVTAKKEMVDLLALSQVLPQAAGRDLVAGAERKPLIASLPWYCACGSCHSVAQRKRKNK